MKSNQNSRMLSLFILQTFKKFNNRTSLSIGALCAVVFFAASCEKPVKVIKEVKTAYVDTSILMKEYQATKDIDNKYKLKGQEKAKGLEAEINLFKQEASNFQAQAQAKGQVWAQQKGAELQRREQQLMERQQQLSDRLQQEGGAEMDSLVSDVKKIIKAYGKQKGYTYIYGTNESNASILYAEDKLDITKDLIKILNDKYKSASTK